VRILRRNGLTAAVVRISTPHEVVVAIPSHLPRAAVLDLARVVLSCDEYEQLSKAVATGPGSARGP
jgi:hypothetical protein